MKDYLSYNVEDFVTDESYLRYYFRENEADIAFWTEWLGLHPEKLDVAMSANNYIDAFSVRISETEFLKEQQRLTQALNDLSLDDDLYQDDASNEEPEISIIDYGYKPRKLSRRIMGAVAVIVVAAGPIVYVALRKSKALSAPSEPANVTTVEKYVPRGERAKITLPDGSEVELNADSKLTYPSKFTGPSRELHLTGEAFFRVQNDPEHPFHVISTNLDVTVLGTSFNMQCYPDKNQTKVALVSGKVRLDRISDPVNKKVIGEALELAPFEMGVFNKSDLSLEMTKYDIDDEMGWRQGIVVFKNAGFNEIADRFDKIYKIRLINKSHKTEFRFTGSFNNISPEEIVKSICLSKKLSYAINGNVITIH
jgi:ferric-dicitrate binding protein FerR (iron transport regulator)